MSDREFILRKLATNLGILVLIIAVVAVPLLSLRAVAAETGTFSGDPERELTVLKDGASDGAAGVTGDEMDIIADMDDVDTVTVGDGAGIHADTAGEVDGDGWNGLVYEYRPSTRPDGVSDGFSLEGDQILAPDSLDGHDFTADLGRDIGVSSTVKTGESTGTSKSSSMLVAGTYGEKQAGLPPNAFFGSHDLVVSLLAKREGVSERELTSDVGFDTVAVTVAQDGDADAVVSALESRGYSAGADKDRPGGVLGALTGAPVLVAVVLLSFMLVVGMLATGAARPPSTRAGVVGAGARGAVAGGLAGAAVGVGVVTTVVGVDNLVPDILVVAVGTFAVLVTLVLAVSWTSVLVSERRYGELGSRGH